MEYIRVADVPIHSPRAVNHFLKAWRVVTVGYLHGVFYIHFAGAMFFSNTWRIYTYLYYINIKKKLWVLLGKYPSTLVS